MMKKHLTIFFAGVIFAGFAGSASAFTVTEHKVSLTGRDQATDCRTSTHTLCAQTSLTLTSPSEAQSYTPGSTFSLKGIFGAGKWGRPGQVAVKVSYPGFSGFDSVFVSKLPKVDGIAWFTGKGETAGFAINWLAGGDFPFDFMLPTPSISGIHTITVEVYWAANNGVGIVSMKSTGTLKVASSLPPVSEKHVNQLFGNPGACGGKVDLHWQLSNLINAGTSREESAPEGVGLTGYEVRRAPSGRFGTDAQKIASVTTSCNALGCSDDSFVDAGLTPGVSYQYDVRGIKKSGGYDYLSNLVTVSASGACAGASQVQFVCRPTATSTSGTFSGNLGVPTGSANSGALQTTKKFMIECWNPEEPNSPHVFDEVAATVLAPDLTAATATVKWLSGPKTGKEDQNIFAEGATLRFTTEIRNIGTASAGASKTGWRAAENTIPEKAERFGNWDPRVETPAVAEGKSVTLMREIGGIRVGTFGIGVCADDERKVDESDETNNCSGVLKIEVVKVDASPPPTVVTPAPTTTGWDGWIKLSGVARDGSPYGVRYDPQTTRLCGEAWGGSVVGWIYFGPKSAAATGCEVTFSRTSAGGTKTVPYRVIPGSDAGDWARLATTVPNPQGDPKDMMLDVNIPIEKQLVPYDKLVLNQSYALTGWAWSSNIGWISLASENHSGAIPYGVTMEVKSDAQDKISGRALKGWAWSSNIGWIKFDAVPFEFSEGVENYPEPRTAREERLKPPSWLNVNTNKLEGWARACAGTENGDCNSASRKD